jgi:hypothetical protein
VSVIVDEMRRGAHSKDAAITVLKRVAKNTVEPRLLTSRNQPTFGLTVYVLRAKGSTPATDALFTGTATDRVQRRVPVPFDGHDRIDLE